MKLALASLDDEMDMTGAEPDRILADGPLLDAYSSAVVSASGKLWRPMSFPPRRS